MKIQRRRDAAGLVRKMVEIGTSILVREFSTEPEKARQVSREIAHNVCQSYGGFSVYIPRDEEYQRDQRDESIWVEFDGTNVLELATKHQLTEMQIYNILKVQREKHVIKTQPRLPGFDAE